jgi:N-acetyl-alpha-D-muramate 1-phosphate uridylyltransferase
MMKAMLLAAGLGTRLKPITDSIPKALVEINGRTLLQINLEKLKSYGFSNVIINLHHFPEKIKSYLKEHQNFGLKIEFSFEEQILNTGGGIKKASWYLKDKQPVLIHNVDILSDLNFSDLLQFHNEQQALATLAVSIRETNRQLLFDENNLLRGWENTTSNEQKLVGPDATDLSRFAFSGIQILSPDFFNQMTEEGAFPIIDTYLRLAATNKITAYRHNPENWFDVGKINELDHIKKKFK